MRSIQLRPLALTTAAVVGLLPACDAQQAVAKNPPADPGAAAKADIDLTGLPTFLLPVPGGTVEVGLTPEQFVDAMCQAVFPTAPKNAAKIAQEKLILAMRRSASLLGRRKVEVPTFLLGKWPVKNSEYEVYVQLLRSLKKPVRPPFHWWRFGRQDDYDARLEDINKEFPKDSKGPLNYWDLHSNDLPYALQDEKGKPIGDLPVTYVSWREANEFAGWIGMRLPTEVEMTRAMRGDGINVWPLGNDQEHDVYSDELLKRLQMYRSSEQHLKPVGSVPAATGPFGHLDLFGQVWQLVADRGFGPIHGKEEFLGDWKKLQKDKTGQLLASPPEWKPQRVMAKGGSYLSYQEPVQLLVDARAPVESIDVLESMGFRLAKSLRPGYDLLFSLMRGSFSRSAFAEGQDIDMAAQIGAERYELADNGFPKAYHAVSFAPVGWLVDEKNADLGKLLERSQLTPILIGALATTEPLVGGAPPGLTTVLYRHKGVPRDLADALKRAHRELVAAQKRSGKEAEAKEADASDTPEDKKDKDKKGTWREVLSRYGLNEQDALSKEAANGELGFVRVDGVEVPTERDAFLLNGSDGKVIAVLVGTKNKPSVNAPFAATLTVASDGQGKAAVKLRIGVPLSPQHAKKFVDFDLHFTLDTPAPSAETPWRQPR